jgi:hypothetical protein
MRALAGICALCLACVAFGQDVQAYKYGPDSLKGGFLDPSRFSVHNSVSFGMASGSGASLQSQGLYSTMLTYKFSQPITLNLNFGLPLFSTFAAGQNLTAQNLSSAEYFRNMPIDLTLAWKATDNMSFMLNIEHAPQGYYSDFSSPLFYMPAIRGASMMIPAAGGR